MNKTNKKMEGKQETHSVIWYKDKSFILKLLGTMALTFGAVFAIDEVFTRFDIEIFQFMTNPFFAYVFVCLLVGLVRIIYEVSKFYNETPEAMEEKNHDSITGMIREAHKDKRYAEVIRLGAALSAALWYSGRHKLRLEIAEFVYDAAERLNKKYTLASVLIEDLGNGTLEATKDAKLSIEYIQKGLRVATENGFAYLTARGYRNLCCAYAYQYLQNGMPSDLEHAKRAYAKGFRALSKIADEKQKLDAKASLYYARVRIFQQERKELRAIDYLKKGLALYEQLAKIPGNNSLAEDRMLKMYRELGKLLVKRPETEEEGLAYIKKALELAETLRDYGNALRANMILLQYYYVKDNELPIQRIIRQCDAYVKEIERADLEKEYDALKEKIKDKWENAF